MRTIPLQSFFSLCTHFFFFLSCWSWLGRCLYLVCGPPTSPRRSLHKVALHHTHCSLPCPSLSPHSPSLHRLPSTLFSSFERREEYLPAERERETLPSFKRTRQPPFLLLSHIYFRLPPSSIFLGAAQSCKDGCCC